MVSGITDAKRKSSIPPWESGSSAYKATGNTGNSGYKFNQNAELLTPEIKKKDYEMAKIKRASQKARIARCKKNRCKHSPYDDSNYFDRQKKNIFGANKFDSDYEPVTTKTKKKYKRRKVTTKLSDGSSFAPKKGAAAGGAAAGGAAGSS
jgi:hypothetical protein